MSPVDGMYHIRHLKQVVSSAEIDIYATLFPTNPPVEIYHLRVVVTDEGKARFNVNDCTTALTADSGILVDYEHPIDLLMARIATISAIRSGSTDATCEILAWW